MRFSLFATILVTVTLSAFAQLALKLGTQSPAVKGAGGEGATGFLVALVTSPGVWIGLAIYGASVLLWLWVLSKTDLSVAYPFVGLSFLVTMMLGAFVLHEPVTPLRVAGTLLIAFGCVLVARSA
jgi:drug/metabolite transporter (DMT)-like permease